MLIDAQQSLLIVVDVQEKLAPLVENADGLIAHCQWLVRLAQTLDIPGLFCQQYPKGLGNTVEQIIQSNHHWPVMDKTHFSCASHPQMLQYIQSSQRRQIILCGIEAHVCVLQSAMELKQAGFDVFIVVDAVSSRHAIDKKYALKRMNDQGITLISREMLAFEWLRDSKHPQFKQISQDFLQS